MIVCYLDGGVRASIDVFGHWNTWPDSCGHGTPKVTVIGCVTAARGGGLSVTLVPPKTAPRRRSEGTDWRPERTIAELHSALRVAVRRPGAVPRWPSRLIADSVPRRLAVALFRLKIDCYRVTNKWRI